VKSLNHKRLLNPFSLANKIILHVTDTPGAVGARYGQKTGNNNGKVRAVGTQPSSTKKQLTKLFVTFMLAKTL